MPNYNIYNNNKNKLSKNNNLVYGLLIIIIIIIIIAIIYLIKDMFFSMSTNTYQALSKNGTQVLFSTNKNNDTILIKANFTDLSGLSGIHIHANNNGKPGPIIAWLVTTPEWQNGVMQNKPNSNSPCCKNNLCNLIAPKGTPFLHQLKNRERIFKEYKCNSCTKCPWIDNGALLVLHGTNFQTDINGVKTKGSPGIDIMEIIPFNKIR